jgi:hypothetical protein
MMARTFLRFGKNRLGFTPVIFWPTPPFFLAKPRRFMVLPATGFLPHIAQIFDIFVTPFE